MISDDGRSKNPKILLTLFNTFGHFLVICLIQMLVTKVRDQMSDKFSAIMIYEFMVLMTDSLH